MAQFGRVRSWILALVLTGTLHLLTAAPAAAQCALCYASVAGSGDQGIRTLQIGILIMLVPTLAILGGLVWITVRRGGSDSAATDGSEMESKWEEGLATLSVSPRTDGPSARV